MSSDERSVYEQYKNDILDDKFYDYNSGWQSRLWAVYGNSRKQKHRTTNSLGSWYSKLNRHI